MSQNRNTNTNKPNLSIVIPVSLKYITDIPSPRHSCSPIPSPRHKTDEYSMNFDGCSKGNPGPSGTGAVIYHHGQEIWASCQYIGTRTNNQSEYSALILGLKEALSRDIKHLYVFGDSQLVINQITGVYKVKNNLLQELYQEVQNLKTQFEHIEFTHVYREFNKRADALSNMALNVLDINMDNENTGLILPSLQKEKDKETVNDNDKVKLNKRIKPVARLQTLFPAI
jgi:ribonuclease HI